jgi:HD-GYP domain-containing protein (c-di-GMP phosphodiesterase class II)
LKQKPESSSCRYHRRSRREAFQIPEELLVDGENPSEQVARLRSLIRDCSHNGYILANHSHDVMTLSVRLAEHVGFDRRQVDAVRTGSYLHDIGKVFTSLDVLLSTKVGLDESEWEEVMRHPTDGAALVTHPDLAIVRRMIGCHHEWPGNPGPNGGGFEFPAHLSASEREAVSAGGHLVNGRHGYPHRLLRADLEDEVLLLSVCDWYAGCAERRSYRQAQPHAVAMQWTENAASEGKVDPRFTSALGRMLAEVPWVPCSSAIETASSVVP